MHAYTECTPHYIFFKQKVFCILTELNAIEITRITCAHFTTRNFPSNYNRVVPRIYVIQALKICLQQLIVLKVEATKCNWKFYADLAVSFMNLRINI